MIEQETQEDNTTGTPESRSSGLEQVLAKMDPEGVRRMIIGFKAFEQYGERATPIVNELIRKHGSEDPELIMKELAELM